MNVQLNSLTSARGIAAWLVVLYHLRASTPWMPSPVMDVLNKGYLAVDFFFMLSGFVIYLSGHKVLERDGARAVPGFLLRRIARIYPLYALILFGTIIFASAIRVHGGDASGYPLRELPLHIVMIQNWGFTEQLSWNHPAWSISTEFAAYLMFPIILLVTPIASARRSTLLIGMILSLVVLALILHFFGQVRLGEDVTHSGTIRCLCEFICGNLLCACWLRGDPQDPRMFATASLIVAVAGTLWASGVANETMVFPAITACIVLMLAQLSLRFEGNSLWPLHWRTCIYLGEISYATYLAHFMLFIIFKLVFVDDASNVAPARIALFLFGLLIASIALHEFVEKPGRRLTRLYPRVLNNTQPAL